MGPQTRDKVAIITGATGGIGYHLTLGFDKAGYSVIAIDHQRHRELPESVDYMEVDLRDEGLVRGVFNLIKERYGKAHVLINNAAIAHINTPIQDIDIIDFDAIMQVNVRGSFLCAKAFLDLNEGEAYGRIINIASTRWLQNEAGWEAYGTSKGALVSMTQSLAITLSDKPVTVNAVSPGWIQPEGYDSLSLEDHKQHPSGRVGKPKDILNACLFLADEENGFINGHNLVVDGGMTRKMIYA